MRRRQFLSMLGGAATAPMTTSFPVHAQLGSRVIGLLHQGSAEPVVNRNAFRKGLSQGGVDSQTVTIEELAANFLPAALAAKAATQTIPIVFLSGSDPIKSGLVTSINRPTGNVTGIAPMFTLLGTKNLELLHDFVPAVRTTGALANLTNPNAEHQLRDLQQAADILRQHLVVLPGSNEREIDSSFAEMAKRQVGALVITADGYLISRQDQIVALAARYRIPTMYPLSQYVAGGGLMSYGANLRDAFRQTGIYVGRILQGMKPSDLPVLQPTKVEFVINLKTAKVLGIEVPPKLLALADEVIE